MRVWKYHYARKLLRQGFPKVDIRTEKSMWFKVKDYDIKVEQVSRDEMSSIEKWSCTCPYSGIQGIANGADCSHILCCKAYLIGVRIKKEEGQG